MKVRAWIRPVGAKDPLVDAVFTGPTGRYSWRLLDTKLKRSAQAIATLNCVADDSMLEILAMPVQPGITYECGVTEVAE